MLSTFCSIRRLSVGAIWLVVGSGAFAQAPDLDRLETISPQDLVAAVVAENHHLLALEAATDAARLMIEPVRARPDPTLSITTWPNSIGAEIGTRKGAQISQPFRWPGRTDLQVSVAEQQANIAFQRREAAQLDIVATSKSAFADWHYVHRAIAINSQNQELVSELTRIAESSFAAGRGLQQDVLQAEMELVMFQQQALVLNRQYRSIRAVINELLNRDPERPIPPPVRLGAPGDQPDTEQLRLAIQTTHPELRRLEAVLAAGNYNVELQDLSSRPNFSAYLGYADTWDEVAKRLQLGVSISLPVGRSRRDAERRAARAEVRRAEHEIEGELTRLLAALEVSYAEVEESASTFELYESRLLPLAQNTLDAAVADYQGGAGPFINIIAAERQQLEAEQGAERALADYWKRRAELERIAGVSYE